MTKPNDSAIGLTFWGLSCPALGGAGDAMEGMP
jgi:hypothetical protein